MASRIKDIAPDIELIALAARYEASSREYFFSEQYDYIADCIDLVSCKLDLIKTAGERGISIISALGTGNKIDAERLTVCDISETEGCPLARVVRKELRHRGIQHLTVVYSPEEGLEPQRAEEPPPGRRSVPGSLIWVPASAGMLIAQHIVLELAGK
jgi:tRNA A37 threonylcarbamoyladenosine dehydratase